MPCGKLAAGLRRNCQRGQARAPANRRSTHRPARSPITSRGPVTGKRRDRHAARQRLQQHQAEGVGPAREHEDVGGGVGLRQCLALPRAEKHRLRIFSRQRRPRRPVADDEFGAGQIELEKRLEILFHRDAADAEKDRPRQTEVARRADETARCRRRAATAPRCESRARAIRSPAPASPPSPPGWRRGTGAAPAQIQDSGTGRRAENIRESGYESWW